MNQSPPTTVRRIADSAPVFLCLVAGGFLFWNLGYTGIAARDEANYSEPAREMLVSGDWLVPRRNGVPRLNKPPLTYWALAVAYRLFGFNAWAGRLVCALAGLGVVVLLLWWMSTQLSQPVCWWAGVALLSSPLFFAEARVTTTDMLLCLWITAAVIVGLEALRGPRPRAVPVVLFFVAAAAGTLTKGPLGLALPGLIVLVECSRRNRWRQVHWPAFVGGFALYAALATPWYILLERAQPGAVRAFLLHENMSRFASGVDHSGRPVWYYVPILLLSVLPWTGLLPPAVWRPARWFRTRQEGEADAVAATLWWFIPFIVFTLSATKLVSYVLPCLPPLAVLLGMELNDRWREEQPPASRHVWLYAQAVFLWVLGAAMIVLPTRLAEVPSAALAIPRLVGGGLTLLGGLAVVIGTARWGVRTGISCLLVAHLVFCGSLLRLFSALEPYQGVRPLAKELRAHGAPAVSVVSWCIPEPGVAFYLRRIVPLYDESRKAELEAKVQREGRVLCLVGPGLETTLTSPTFAWTVRRLGGNHEATIVELRAKRPFAEESPP